MIAKLPDDVINQIAAGEVVERPASVIKELVENSIDAQATEISITVKQYGLELIRVIDNGTGVAREDLATVFNKHFTSKLRTTEDLLNVLSFGFRGEALASVGSVAEVDFESKHADAEAGYKITCNYGSLSDITPSPLQEGTRIEVRNLFESIPARKKFLKSKATENKSIIEVLNRFIISNPDISFHVIVDSVRKHYPKALLNERIENVMHIPHEDLIPIHYQGTEVTLSGFVLHPRHNFSRRTHQYIFVNHRPISDTIIQKAVIDGYDTFLMKQQYPAYVLFIEMPPAKVDINVHPRKTEVRFAASNNIYMQVRTTVNATLLKNSRREMRAKLHYEEPVSNKANVVYETEATYQPTSVDNTPHGEFEKFLYPEQTEKSILRNLYPTQVNVHLNMHYSLTTKYILHLRTLTGLGNRIKVYTLTWNTQHNS
ncbi:MAG: DNA mismatch repair endonuclease MutL [Candidatus Dojkabacteria bacterium]